MPRHAIPSLADDHRMIATAGPPRRPPPDPAAARPGPAARPPPPGSRLRLAASLESRRTRERRPPRPDRAAAGADPAGPPPPRGSACHVGLRTRVTHTVRRPGGARQWPGGESLSTYYYCGGL
eukprot:697721-Hanusia_phi.AAC.1